MRKITFFFLLLTVSLGYSQVVLEDFETLPATEFTGFEGLGGANLVADPAAGGTNGQVGEIISSSAGQGWQGAQLLMQSNFMDLSTTNTVEVEVYSDVAFTLFAKVEDNVNMTAPASAADEAHTGSGWETLTFTFNESLDGTVAANGEYNLLALFPNWNGAGWNTPPGDFTVYVNDVKAVQGAALPFVSSLDLMEDFEAYPAGDFTTFEGAMGGNLVSDPAAGGTNGQVGEIISSSAGQGWQGAQMLMQSNFMDLTSEISVEVDVYSTTAFTMFAKVEDNINTTAPASAAATAHTGSGWEILTFTFDEALDGTVAANGEYNLMAFFPNWNGAGWNTPPGDFTVYIDNIRATTGSAIAVDTCSNGVMDGDETGVDCGGSCTPCATGGMLELMEDFEALPAGEFTGFEGLGGANIVADPAAGGTNGQVGEIISSSAGQGWQGAQLLMQSNFMDLTSNNTVEVDVYSDVAFTMFGKVEDNINTTAPASAADEAHTGSGWETLTFTFDEALDGTVAANGEYNLMAFFPNWNGAGWNTPPGDFTVYIDNIRAVVGSAITVDTCTNGVMDGDETGVDCGGSCEPCAAAPMDAPPTPPARAAADVISIYSEAYGTEVGLNNVPWDDPSNITEETIASNRLLKVDFDQFLGTDLGSIVDASAMTHFHMDYWVADDYVAGQVFNLKWSNHTGGMGETDAASLNTAFSSQADVQNWVSIDVPLTDFVTEGGGGIANRADLAQFLITVAGLTKVVYIDNIYFHKNTVLSTDDFETASFKAFPNPTNGNWNVTGNSIISKVVVYDVLGKEVIALQPNATEVVINALSLYSGVYFARIEGLSGSQTVKLIKQ